MFPFATLANSSFRSDITAQVSNSSYRLSDSYILEFRCVRIIGISPLLDRERVLPSLDSTFRLLESWLDSDGVGVL